MTDSRSPPGRPARVVLALFVAAWLAVVTVPPALFLGWREARLTQLAAPAVQRDWDRFRADMREQSGNRGPVRRKVPRSAEPPERVWLRDHPVVIVVAWVVFVGLLGAVIGMLFRGAVVGTAVRTPPFSGRG